MTTDEMRNIELLVLDVDGVLTDGRIILSPSGEETKVFNARDGAGMKFWKRAGGKLALISGRGSPAVEIRATELGVDALRLNARDKLPALEEVLEELGAAADRTAVVGDDLTDVPMLRRCGFAVTTCEAPEEVRSVADYVTRLGGGAGCVREVVELLLKRAGKWDDILSRYFPAGRESRR
jgi:3-deoxy-D-manno-octulosonate 8-phosphate phosphatase (KDO 8-P phosphatase)